MAKRDRPMAKRIARKLTIEYVWIRGNRMGIHVRFPDGSIRNFTHDRDIGAPRTRGPLRVADRWKVLARDDFTCRYCGRRPPAVVLEVDHIIPVADGGSDDHDNLGAACFDCNRGKGRRPLGGQIGGQEPPEAAPEGDSPHETAA